MALDAPTILIGGTWSLTAPGENPAEPEWYRPQSTFAKAGLARGMRLLFPDMAFEWCSGLDGVLWQGTEPLCHWYGGGAALLYYWMAAGCPQVNIITHSHGAQVALEGIMRGVRVGKLLTIAPPVRADMADLRQRVALVVQDWINIYSVFDPVQVAGEVGDGGGALAFPREISVANKNLLVTVADHVEHAEHSALHDVALWNRLDLWALLD